MKELEKGQVKAWQLAAKIAAVVLLISIGAFYTIQYWPQIMQLAEDPGSLKELLISYGGAGILIFIGIQIIQVIIAFLPGEVTQLAGGYIYGAGMGTLYSMTGITIGSIIVFFTSRFLGYSLIKLFVPKELFQKLGFLINSPRSELIMFILFVIPGMPKDCLSYLAGLTPVKAANFLFLSSIARLPALFVSSYVGANIQQGNLTMVIIVAALSCLILAIGFFNKDKILMTLQRKAA